MWLLPKPYPDEALGSILIRAQLVNGFSFKHLLSRLYGGGRGRSTHSFHLTTAAPQIASRCGMDSSQFLRLHTAFPYATACLAKDYAQALEAKYLGDLSQGQISIASLVSNVSQGAPTRRYCIHCARDDFRRYGETYWHRVHQLSTVLVCPDHLTPLAHTDVRSALAHGQASLGMPSPAYSRPRTLLVPADVAVTMARLSKNLLMGWYDKDADWNETYRQQARELAFVHHYGALATGVASLALSELFGAKYLDSLGCKVTQPFERAWPALLMRSSRNQFVSVVRHVLMQTFLVHGRMDDRLDAMIKKVVRLKGRDYRPMDIAAQKLIQQEIGKHAAAGTRTTVGHLLEVAGIKGSFRHNREMFPNCRMILEAFKGTEQSLRQLGGRAYWRSRVPSRWGLPSKRALRANRADESGTVQAADSRSGISPHQHRIDH